MILVMTQHYPTSMLINANVTATLTNQIVLTQHIQNSILRDADVPAHLDQKIVQMDLSRTMMLLIAHAFVL